MTSRRATALVELALVLPLIFLFLTAIVDLGRFLHVQLLLESMVGDAARYATLKHPTTGALPTPQEVAARLDAIYPSPFRPYTFQVDTAATLAGEPAVTCQLSCRLRPFLMNMVGASSGDPILTAAGSQPRR